MVKSTFLYCLMILALSMGQVEACKRSHKHHHSKHKKTDMEQTAVSDRNRIQSIRNEYEDRMGTQVDIFHGEQAIEQYVHRKVNEYRQSKGLRQLEYIDAIADIAREHSENMARGVVPHGHDGFDQRFKDMQITVHARSAGENVAYNYGYDDPALVAVNGWIKSDGHRKNMEGDFTLTGVGVVVSEDGSYYFTHLFAK